MKKIIVSALAAAALLLPSAAIALEMPASGNALADMIGIEARSYVVRDVATGEILLEKNADMAWTPASLTKLVTALVVLDTKPSLKKTVIMSQQDQVAGGCSIGGACIISKAGVGFTVDGLFHAMLMPSANNAASALARSTGLSADEFAARMNEKAASLGATGSHFNEPTGMDPLNATTARDYALIVQAAFSSDYLRSFGSLTQYRLVSTNNSKYSQTIKNTNKLLGDAEVSIAGAKTGYLDESLYNFASLLTYRDGPQLAVVVLGEQYLSLAFAETKTLARIGQDAKSMLAMTFSGGAVLGASISMPAVQ